MVDGVEEQSRFAGWRREVWLFMKAQLSAQIATVIDFLITILLVKLFGIYYLYATFIGSVCRIGISPGLIIAAYGRRT